MLTPNRLANMINDYFAKNEYWELPCDESVEHNIRNKQNGNWLETQILNVLTENNISHKHTGISNNYPDIVTDDGQRIEIKLRKHINRISNTGIVISNIPNNFSKNDILIVVTYNTDNINSKLAKISLKICGYAYEYLNIDNGVIQYKKHSIDSRHKNETPVIEFTYKKNRLSFNEVINTINHNLNTQTLIKQNNMSKMSKFSVDFNNLTSEEKEIMHNLIAIGRRACNLTDDKISNIIKKLCVNVLDASYTGDDLIEFIKKKEYGTTVSIPAKTHRYFYTQYNTKSKEYDENFKNTVDGLINNTDANFTLSPKSNPVTNGESEFTFNDFVNQVYVDTKESKINAITAMKLYMEISQRMRSIAC